MNPERAGHAGPFDFATTILGGLPSGHRWRDVKNRSGRFFRDQGRSQGLKSVAMDAARLIFAATDDRK